MNLEFALAVAFGLGMAGFLSQVIKKPTIGLLGRVGPRGIVTSKPKEALGFFGVSKFSRWSLTKISRRRSEKALFELPEILGLLVVSLEAGDGIYKAFTAVIPRCEGELARELTRVLGLVEYGAAFGEEIRSVATAIPNPQVAEFTSKVALALERGTPLARMLSEQSDSARAEIRNKLLRQAGKNETRMLIPLVFLILPITVLFAIYPSLELLNFGFI
jgi:tight adherence protein C